MKTRFITRVGILALLSALLVPSLGCNLRLWGSNTGSLITGWLLGSVANASGAEHLCYENGVLIDCADLPADLGE